MNGRPELVAALVAKIVAKIPEGTEPGPVRSGLPRQIEPQTVEEFERRIREAEYRFKQRKGWTEAAALAPDGTVHTR